MIEVAIVSTVAAMPACYPLAWHIVDGRAAGLADDDLRALISGGDAPGLSPAERAVARLARQLTNTAAVDDGSFDAAMEHLDEQKMVEVIMLVGLYNLVGRVANALDVELDDDAPRPLDG